MGDTPDDMKVNVAAVHLEGRALHWHLMYMKTRFSREFPEWEEYVRALRHRFSASTYLDHMSELVASRQTGTVQDFLDQFDELLNEVELTEEAISCLFAGLKPEISVQVRLLNPRTLMKTYSQAKLVEKSSSLQRTTNSSYSKANSSILPNPKPIFNQSYKPNPIKNIPTKTFNKPTRLLTGAEMDEKRSKGLCYWCDEKYVPGHNCRKGRQLYLLEAEEEEEQHQDFHEVEEEITEEGEELLKSPQVSVHAISRAHDY